MASLLRRESALSFPPWPRSLSPYANTVDKASFCFWGSLWWPIDGSRCGGGLSLWRPGCYHNMMTCSLTSCFYLPGKKHHWRISYPSLCWDYYNKDFASSSVKKGLVCEPRTAIPSWTKDNHVKGTIVWSVTMILLCGPSFTSSVASPLKCIPLGGWYLRPASDHQSDSAKFPIRKECSWRFEASQPASRGFALTVGQSISDRAWATWVEWDRDLDIPFTTAECAYRKEIHIDIGRGMGLSN